jgi:hypothetical protein
VYSLLEKPRRVSMLLEYDLSLEKLDPPVHFLPLELIIFLLYNPPPYLSLDLNFHAVWKLLCASLDYAIGWPFQLKYLVIETIS